MPSRQQLKELSKLRLREAEVLFEAGLYDGVSYLSGYAIELALKARICRVLDVPEYPATGQYGKVYAVHNFEQLRFLAGLSGKISVLDSPELFENWSIATPWGPERRYAPPGTCSKQSAEDILNAIRDRDHGVLSWIKRYW